MGPYDTPAQPGQLRRMLGAASPGARKTLTAPGLGALGAPAAPGAAVAPVAAASAPVTSSSTPDTRSALPGLLGAKKIRKGLANLNYQNAQRAQGPLWDAINDLIGQSQEDRFSPEGRAQFLAPRMEAYDRQERQVLGSALRDQAGRGLDESSYGGAVDGTIRSQFGAARAGAINDLYQSEEQRQLQVQALLRDVLMGLQGRSSQQAAGIADSITNFRLQQQQLDAANDPMAMLGSILGGGASLAFQGGWKPFAPPK